ncbi:hypothetical protein GCM10020219_000050 [Nonomuraea dietziae]
MTLGDTPQAPAAFRRAVESLRMAEVRPEIELEDLPAPQRLAPFTAAIGASVYRDDEELAVGRLILLFDPEGQRGWQGQFRLVAYVRADMEPEITSDPMLGPVVWSWLTRGPRLSRGGLLGGRRHGDQGGLRGLRRQGRRPGLHRAGAARVVVSLAGGPLRPCRRLVRPDVAWRQASHRSHPTWPRCRAVAKIRSPPGRDRKQ